MTTSASVDFELNRDQIIKAALQKIEAIGQGETPNATQVSEAAIAFNALVKAWHGIGMPLWATSQAYVLPVSNTSAVTLSATGGHATLSYTHTNTSAASSSGGSTITVDSTTGISNGYYIGVEMDDGTMHWTTVNGAPAGSVVTLTSALTGDVDTDADVYIYQTKLNKPLRVINAYVVNPGLGNRYKINMVGRDTYYSLGNLSSEGVPNQVYYDAQLSSGTLSFFPRFVDGDRVIELTIQRPFEDFDSATDTPDFPQSWIRALIWGLAYELAPDYGVPKDERAALWKEVYGPGMILDQAKESDTEYGSVFFEVGTEYAPE